MPTSALIDCVTLESDVLCFTHLRWHWMPSRLQQGFVAAARGRRVFIVEEPVFVPGAPVMDVEHPHEHLAIARPCLPYALLGSGVEPAQRILLDSWLAALDIRPAVAWYHSAGAFSYTSHLTVPITVYERVADSAALPEERFELARAERELLARADVVYAERGAALDRIRRMHADVRAMPLAGAMPAFFSATSRPIANDVQRVGAIRRSTGAALLPGDRPREEGAEHLQGPRLQAGGERGPVWQEPRLERGP